jgi:hypothetical protein
MMGETLPQSSQSLIEQFGGENIASSSQPLLDRFNDIIERGNAYGVRLPAVRCPFGGEDRGGEEASLLQA